MKTIALYSVQYLKEQLEVCHQHFIITLYSTQYLKEQLELRRQQRSNLSFLISNKDEMLCSHL